MEPVINTTQQQEILRKIKCFVMDLDGTVYLGKRILDGAIDFLHTLEKNKIKFKFLRTTLPRIPKYMWTVFVIWGTT